MDGKFNKNQRRSIEREENDNTTESGPDSPPYSLLNDMKMTSTSSPKRSSKRSVQKRVISVPIKDVDGSRLKGENAPPPSDSWAWRKYGQKPIKGSPYPRGYYRCSSSKGCPARKQVERSRVDPTVLLVTYSCDHNHPWPPPSRTHHHQNHSAAKPPPSAAVPEVKPEPEPEPEPEEKFADLGDESLMSGRDEFSWFGEMEVASSTILESPIFAEDRSAADAADDVAVFFPVMGEEDESLFADLGELPECSAVFRHQQVQIC